MVCDIPVPPLSQDAPNYDRPWNAPTPAPALDISKYPEPADYGEVLLKLMSSPDMASKRWIWEQYDRHVMGDTIDSSQSGGDAAIVRIHGTNKGLAICSDCNPHYVAADPYEGGKQAVAEAYRNLSAVGATPIAITDNLNFGNPEKPDTMGVIVKAIEGMAEACRVLEFPVVSGNVSLYNETDGVGIPPTPVVGGIGLIENLDHVATLKGAQAGDVLILLGETHCRISARPPMRAYRSLGLDGAPAGVCAAVDLDDREAQRRHRARADPRRMWSRGARSSAKAASPALRPRWRWRPALASRSTGGPDGYPSGRAAVRRSCRLATCSHVPPRTQAAADAILAKATAKHGEHHRPARRVRWRTLS